MRFSITPNVRALGAIAALGLSACSGSGTSPGNNTVANVASSVLQMSVGTANIFGDAGAAATTGLNVVVTYRQAAGALNVGASATLVNSPTLTLPSAVSIAVGKADSFDATIATGPAPGETTALTSTAQTATTTTTFGTSGGAFGFGIEPFNYNAGGVPDSIVPYAVPAFDALAAAGDGNAFTPWGGPPAFDPNKDGLGVRDGNTYPDGVLGISEGLDVLQGIARTPGSYGLSIAVTGNTGTTTQAVSATLGSATLLPAVTPAAPALDGNGGGTFAVTLPAGVTEAYVQVTDLGPDPDATTQPAGCNTASATAPVYYTFEVTASGTVTLSDSVGPGTPKAPSPSICTASQNAAATSTNLTPTTDGDTFAVQTIGFDYPAYESSYPNSLGKPSPTLSGANGQSDITISSQAQYSQLAMGGSIVKRSVRVHAPLVRLHR